MEAQDNKTIEVPIGKSKEEFNIRKQIIRQFYQMLDLLLLYLVFLKKNLLKELRKL